MMTTITKVHVGEEIAWEVEYLTTAKITQEMIDDFLCAAFEGGITYWCNKIEVGGGSPYPEGATYGSECLSRGRHIRIWDGEDEIWYDLTLNNFLKAIAEEAQAQHQSIEEMYENHDATIADNIVQRALFGKLVYG